jgi:hypothetical protein
MNHLKALSLRHEREQTGKADGQQKLRQPDIPYPVFIFHTLTLL